METIHVDIVNPKAKKLLKELADLKLINIRENEPVKSFSELLGKLRSKHVKISLDEITKEVEAVRTKRHANKS
jgi:hypothetical protein